MTRVHFVLLLALLLAAPAAATRAPSLATPPIPLPGPLGWSKVVDNPYFPLRPGTVRVYETRAGNHTGTDTVFVLHSTRTILGITAVIVRDRTYENGLLAEDSFDWYAQDAAGNVWCLGEDSRQYRAGKFVNAAGSWEAGKAQAQPGIMMWASPRPGQPYRQEFCYGIAEDIARVLDASAWATVAGATYSPCVQIVSWSTLEPGVKEQRWYARGVGMVRMKTVEGANEGMELVKVITR
jgi:hypothetical protein